MQPNVAKVTNTEQMVSSRNENHREVIRNKNHASTGGRQRLQKNSCSVLEQWSDLIPSAVKSVNTEPECRSWCASNASCCLSCAPKARMVHKPWIDEDRWEKMGLLAARQAGNKHKQKQFSAFASAFLPRTLIAWDKNRRKLLVASRRFTSRDMRR